MDVCVLTINSSQVGLGLAPGLERTVFWDILDLVVGSDRDEDLTNLDTGCGPVSFAKGSSHSGLKSISTGTTQHFVDSQDMEGMDSHSYVETILATILDEILVTAN